MGYDAKDLQVLEGLDAVRLRPGMYIGGTGNKGLHHILWEIVDNSIDEAANGYATQINVKLYPDGSASVEDNGRGVPVDKHPKLGISGVEVVFTQLHAGAKFGNANYAFSGGLHGVGASVTNALSRWLKVEVYKDGKTYKQEFASVEVNGKIRSGSPQTALIELAATDGKKKGTFVHFMPDDRVFLEEQFNEDIILRRLKELAYLNKGIKISFEDLKEGGKKRNYCFAGGIKDLVRDVNAQKQVLFPEPIYVNYETKNFQLELAFQSNDTYTDSIITFVNNIPTTEGGTHVTGMKSAYTRVFNEYARKRGILKEKDDNLIGDDYQEGLTAVLSVRMQNTQFEGQTKTKLGNPEARTMVEAALYEKLTEEINKPSCYTSGDIIVKKGQDAARVRESTRKSKELARKKNSITNSTLVGKLASCTGRDFSKRELFIVEGDSAGGSAKQGRDRTFQAILPLRGKPLNAEKTRLDKILGNEEIRTIISALGTGLDADFNLSDLKYDKVIILADADQDGAHIRAILLTFFYRYMKDLITDGHVYIGMPPLYRVQRGNNVQYAYDDAELIRLTEATGGKGYTLQRYKGLGEMNPEQLWETTMDPDRRELMQVSIADIAEAERIISTLMGDDIVARKQYIYEYANFNKIDKFAEII